MTVICFFIASSFYLRCVLSPYSSLRGFGFIPTIFCSVAGKSFFYVDTKLRKNIFDDGELQTIDFLATELYQKIVFLSVLNKRLFRTAQNYPMKKPFFFILTRQNAVVNTHF